MKYTEEQKDHLKKKKMLRFTRHNRFIPRVEIVGEYYIIESKLNN